MPSILVINPNSSVHVTENLRQTVTAPEGVVLHFYTAPAAAPKEIDGHESSIVSEQVALPDILQKGLHTQHDGFLVCCYSDHPLVHSLAALTDKPVMGIMQATLLYSYANARLHKSFVLTSTSGWIATLDQAITTFAGSGTFPSKKFHPTRALDVSVLSLADPAEFNKITTRVDSILWEFKHDQVDCVLLGCAGMAGLDEKLTALYPGIVFVDSVKIGVEFLSSLMHFSNAATPTQK